jgi:hypothetical protein
LLRFFLSHFRPNGTSWQRIGPSVWGIPPERFTSQAFWDALEKILPDRLDPLATGEDDPLDHAQLRLLDLWKVKQMVSRRLLAYDTTNFHT